MDLGLYFRVIRRFKWLVLGGLVVAIGLSVLAVARVSFVAGKPKLAYRQGQMFQAETMVFVTQKGFPWGSTIPTYLPANPSTPPTPQADPNRLATLATLYAQLATSDQIQAQLHAHRAPVGTFTVNTVPAPAYSNPAILPLLKLDATSPTAADAMVLANDAATVFGDWLRTQQKNAGIPPERRVVVQTVERATKATLVAGRSKTLAAVVFLTVMAATLGLAFVLENMRPRQKTVAATAAPQAPPATAAPQAPPPPPVARRAGRRTA
jgi:hypothetical protein